MRADLKYRVSLYISRLRLKLSITEKIESNARQILLSIKSGDYQKADDLLEENSHLISESCTEDYECSVILEKICSILCIKDHYFLKNLSLAGSSGLEIEKLNREILIKSESSRKIMNEIIEFYEKEQNNLKKNYEEIASLVKMNTLLKFPPE
ncbi:MAG TPA: hypothetical protein PK158_11465 [Spirochaetota bacterium]|nr:hypothetical protein [Spirochaetota bacterium]